VLYGKEGLPMRDTMEALLELLEFQVLDVTVRFYDGGTSVEEVHSTREQLGRVRQLASSDELAQHEFFAFRRPATRGAAHAGH
jgi:hypothetical protein